MLQFESGTPLHIHTFGESQLKSCSKKNHTHTHNKGERLYLWIENVCVNKGTIQKRFHTTYPVLALLGGD